MFHKRLLKEFRETKKYISGIVLTQWLMLIANIIFIFMTSQLIGKIFEKNLIMRDIAGYIAVALAVVLVRFGLTMLNGKFSFQASSFVKGKLRRMIYEKLIAVGPDYYETCSSSEVVQLSTEGVDQLEIYFEKYIPQFFYAMIAPVTLFFVVAKIYLPVAIVLLICVPLIPGAIMSVQKFAKKLLNKYWGNYTELGDNFLENLQGLTTMKIYQADGHYAKKMHEESEKFRKITMRVLIMQLNSISIMDLVAYGGAAAGIIISLFALKNGSINLSQCFFIIMVSAEFFLPMRLLGSFFHIAMNGNEAANRIFRLMDLQAGGQKEEDGQEQVYEDKNRNYINKEEPVIQLKNLSFSYKDSDRIVLENISLEIKPHSFVAFAGISGCGKSTLASLIMGEHKGYQGELLVDGQKRREMKDSLCMSKITRVTHDSYLFSGTVWDNLLMGIPKKTRMEISSKEDADNKIKELMYHAMKKARIYDFIMNHGGLSMKIMENASNLSGGQKQRLALARAILHDSDVYIFDEATSNIDVESEEKIMQAMKDLAKEKTVVVISHRLANIVDADQIFMMEAGKIAAEGTHEELMSGTENAYQKLYKSQQQLERYVNSSIMETLGSDDAYEEADEEEEAFLGSQKDETDRENSQKERKRSGFRIMGGLVKLVKPLVVYMLFAILLGCLGNLVAEFITILGGYGILRAGTEGIGNQELTGIVAVLIIFAVSRGILRYGEQACNHFIAFKLLAKIRDEIFAVLRKLAPAKLEGRNKGNLISMITSDTELLEVFYAHTISPIVIAVITTVIMTVYIGEKDILLGITALCFYVIVGVFVPVINGKIGGSSGFLYREVFAKLNTVVLDNLRGMTEILQFHQEQERGFVVEQENERLKESKRKLKNYESVQTGITNTVILLAGAVMLVIAGMLVMNHQIESGDALLAVIAMMSSFGPVAAISSLSNNLNQTLASGDRVLDLLKEKPMVEEISGKQDMEQGTVCLKQVSFSYPEMNVGVSRGIKQNLKENQKPPILEHYSAEFPSGKVTGIIGKSGCGKSTILKLLMRFFETDSGEISFGGKEISQINTSSLRSHISYVTQETWLFHDTIEENLRIAKLHATNQEIEEACKKASIHEFITRLPKGYQTRLAELGSSLSGGERQRIGIARAFLSGSDMILLDEPTSNLDSLNEAVILKALKQEKENKTIILVSHRKSTMSIADEVIRM